MRKLTHQEIVDRQKKLSQGPFLPITVVLCDIRSLYNVGSIFRTADGAGVEKIWLCGITGCPPHPQIAKTAIGAEERIPWEHHEDALFIIKEMKDQGYEIVFLEQMDGSISYEMYTPQEKVCLVVGNEIEGIKEELIRHCDVAIEIEMAGIKNSLNVGVGFGVAVYHIRNQIKGG